jgi:hypothetical protein
VFGATPEEAIYTFVGTLRQAIDCVTDAELVLHQGYHPPESPHSLVLNDTQPVRLDGPPELWFKFLQRYRIVESPSPLGQWRVTTVAYYYALDGSDGREIVAYHWHPGQSQKVTVPHLHLSGGAMVRHPAFEKVHFPTERIAVEDLLRFAIGELGVTPRLPDWQRMLNQTQQAFLAARSWPISGIA